MDIVRAKESDTLEYAIYFNEDESEAAVIERFASSEALLEHGANISDFHRRSLRRRPSRASSSASRARSFARSSPDPSQQLFTPYMSLKPR